MSNTELLSLPCDVLIPAALGNQITSHNAHQIAAQIIIEGANGPTTPDADAMLFDQGCLVVPDVLSNAGGVIVSYFEWVQGLQSFFWSETEVYTNLKRIMNDAFTSVMQLATQRQTHLRTAAYLLAVERVAQALETRGIYP